MRNTRPYTVDLQYFDGFDERAPSEAELALIGLLWPELMVELAVAADADEKERHGGRTVRAGLDE